MNGAVKILKIFAAMSDHGTREGGHGFGGNLDRAGNEELVVWDHGVEKRPTSNVQRPTLNSEMLTGACTLSP